MVNKQIVIEVSNGALTWEEDHFIPQDESGEDWAKKTIASLNSSLRAGEKTRTLISVRCTGILQAYMEKDRSQGQASMYMSF